MEFLHWQFLKLPIIYYLSLILTFMNIFRRFLEKCLPTIISQMSIKNPLQPKATGGGGTYGL
jgi:hypothetical protein